MKILKRAATIIMLTVMAFSFTACGASASKEPVVAKIGDISITKSDLDNAMAQTDYYLQMYYGQDFKENAEMIPTYNSMLDQNVQQLIGYELLVMKAKENKEIVVSEEVEEQLAAVKASFGSDEEFDAALKETGMTLEELKENIEKDLYYQKIVETYKDSVQVTDEEISDYYNENIAQYTKKPGANVYHILVDSEDKAKEVLKEYEAGKSFADLAAQYGTDGTKDQGGALGYIEYATTDYDADFMAGAKVLGEGEISAPVKTQFGWHIIKVDGVQNEETIQPLEEVKESIQTTLAEQKANEALTEAVEGWKAESKIEIYEDVYQLAIPEASAEASSDATTKEETKEETPASDDASTESTTTSK